MNDLARTVPALGLTGEDPLVLAMPRRELFRFSGFITAIDLGVIESIGGESWYAVASSLVGNLDAKEVRLGLLIERDGQVLVDEAGSILHVARVGPEVGKLASGIKGLRDLALLAGARFVGVERVRCELTGFLNEDAIPGYRDALVLIYRCRVPPEAQTPPAMSWVGPRQLAHLAIDPVAAMIAEKLYPPPATPAP
jgi:hypothetical protein